MSETPPTEPDPQEELVNRLASALSVAQRNGFTLHGQAQAALKAHAEWWPEPSENKAYLAAFKVRHGRETDGKEFDGQLWQWLRVAHEAMCVQQEEQP